MAAVERDEMEPVQRMGDEATKPFAMSVREKRATLTHRFLHAWRVFIR